MWQLDKDQVVGGIDGLATLASNSNSPEIWNAFQHGVNFVAMGSHAWNQLRGAATHGMNFVANCSHMDFVARCIHAGMNFVASCSLAIYTEASV